MKIIHLIWALPIGGAETMLVGILNEQASRNKITLIVVNDNVDNGLVGKLDKNVKVLKLKRSQGSLNPLILIKLWLYIFNSRCKVIHCHSEGLYKVLPGFLFKTCLTVHDTRVDFSVLKKFNQIFAISKIVEKKIREKSNLNSTLIYNGIDTKFSVVKKKYQFEIFRIVQVSRLDHNHKGQHILLEALNKIVHQDQCKMIKVDFIGNGQSREYLESLVKKYKLKPFVRFLGELDNDQVLKGLHRYELLIQPSLYEGFGLTVVEGMVAKIPVLVADNEGPMEIIQDGDYGDYFETGNAEDCARKIMLIRENYQKITDPCHLQTIKEYCEENFSIKKTASNYLKFY